MEKPPQNNLEATMDWAVNADPESVIKGLGTDRVQGLSRAEGHRRLAEHGPNEVAASKAKTWYHHLFSNLRDPLGLLLLGLGIISYLTGDPRAAVIIGVMLALSVTLRFVQETRADHAAAKLKSMVHTTATVLRGGLRKEVPLSSLVPGDVVLLSAGDMIPADLRLIDSRDLYLNQAALTGESLPVEKRHDLKPAPGSSPRECPNACYMGTNVGSGTGAAIVIATGRDTKFGVLAQSLIERPETPTSFDRGVDRYAKLMIRLVMVMVPIVFLTNGFFKHDWFQAFIFAIAVAVGLTPELLPVLVTVNLSKGALDMARRKVIVKRLNAIQDFGAMDVLCTDKTGTLTHGHVALVRYVGIDGRDNPEILDFACLNSHFQTGLNNMLDEAVLKRDPARAKTVTAAYRKVDEIPFDFRRRRMSVVVENASGDHVLICKGAVEEVLAETSCVMVDGQSVKFEQFHQASKDDVVHNLSAEGFRLIALAYKKLPDAKKEYSVADESCLTLLGFLAFLDPAKETAGAAIRQLQAAGVKVKILTGDNELVTRKICNDVGLKIDRILLGHEIAGMSETELEAAVEEATVFDKLEPEQKELVIRALQRRGHVVGFLGDGINDAPALKAADVGISVDGAVDIAKESSDIILLEKSLTVLHDGVLMGRRAFGNIVKYIKMTGSSNFGNMFSVVGGSIFLPFLPMLPIQIIVNNLLYDISQTSIPTDGVDEEYLAAPRQWRIDKIQKYVLLIGPVSSIFDYATFILMLYVFNCWANPTLFHTGWFVESLLTQTLIIHVIRTNRIPFIQSRASLPLTLTTLGIVALGIWLPFSPFASALGFVPLPPAYWLYIIGFLITYFVLTQLVKRWFVKRFGQV
jgi:Mg2+-importing ATPase